MAGYGLVLAGGGGKGAYQLGAWKALKEMDVRFDAIVGASIGSINGALIAADEYDKAVDMWNNISIDKGLKINSDLPDPENLLSKKNWGTLFREFIKKGGIDASPAKEFVSQYIDEEKVRASVADFGVIAVQLSQPGGKYEFFLDSIPEGELVNYLMASASVPFTSNIGPEGEKYLDGGAYDNIPVTSLKKRGYNRLIVVDISNIKGVGHSLDLINSQIIYIRPYDMEELGAAFDFEPATIEKRIQLGYYDTKKAFSHLSGKIYYFLPKTFRSMVIKYGADTVLQLEELAYSLGVDLLQIYTAEGFILASKEAFLAYRKESEAKKETPEVKPSSTAENESKPTLLSRLKEKQDSKENEQSFIRSTLKKRFSSKNPLTDYPDAVALMDNYII